MKETITHNLSKAESQGLNQLKKHQNINIFPADKGNVTVIMDKEDYEYKINDLISTGNYNKLQKDPTTIVERKIYTTLKQYKNELPDRLRSKVTRHFNKPLVLYGLPKIHKPETLPRPIVGSRNSPCNPLKNT